MMSLDTFYKDNFTTNTTSAFQSGPWLVQVYSRKQAWDQPIHFSHGKGGEGGQLDGVPSVLSSPSYLERWLLIRHTLQLVYARYSSFRTSYNFIPFLIIDFGRETIFYIGVTSRYPLREIFCNFSFYLLNKVLYCNTDHQHTYINYWLLALILSDGRILFYSLYSTARLQL